MPAKISSIRIRKSESIFIWTAMSGMLIATLVWPGFFLSDIAVKLNLSNFQTGLLNAASNIMLPLQLGAALFCLRRGHRKTIFVLFTLLLRLAVLFLGLALLLYSARPFGHISALVIGVVMALHLSCSLTVPVFFDWVADIVPQRDNDSFWGKRTALVFVSGIVSGLAVGFAFKYAGEGLLVNALFLVAAGILGLVETAFYLYIPAAETPPGSGTPPLLAMLRDSFVDLNFRSFMVFNSLFNFAGMMFSSFFFIHLLRELEWSALKIQVFVVAGELLSFVGCHFWSEIAALRGNKPVIIISMVIKVFEFAGYTLMVRDGSWWFALPFFLAGGFANGGIATATSAMLTAETPKDGRMLFTAMFFSVSGAAGAAGAVAGGFAMSLFGNFHASVFGVGFGAFHIIILANIAAMLLCVLFILPYRAGLCGSAIGTAMAFFEGNPALSFLRLVKLTGKTGFQERHSFISRNRSSLFAGEIVDALDDPSPFIRYRAVYSLGGIKAPASETALLRELENEERGLAVGAAYSLGRLKSAAAAAPLGKSILSEDRSLRAAAAWALGEIHAPESLDVLRRALASEKSGFASAYMADALGGYGDLSSIELIFDKLSACPEPGLRFQFCVAIANIISGHGGFYECLVRERQNPFSAVEALLGRIQPRLAGMPGGGGFTERVMGCFEDKDYSLAARECFKAAYRRRWPELYEGCPAGDTLRQWSREDFDRLKKSLDAKINTDIDAGRKNVIVYGLRFLYVIAHEVPGGEERAFEDALLALHILGGIV
jgi:MFS family permease